MFIPLVNASGSFRRSVQRTALTTIKVLHTPVKSAVLYYCATLNERPCSTTPIASRTFAMYISSGIAPSK